MWESIRNAFINFNVAYVLEWVLFFLLIYYVFRTLKNNNAKQLIVVYAVLVVCTGIVMLGSGRFDVTAYLLFVVMLSMFFLLLFATEIKRAIWTGKHGTSTTFDSARSAVGARADEYIASIVRAVQNLSKSNTGALIVLSNGNLPKEIMESGVSVSYTHLTLPTNREV